MKCIIVTWGVLSGIGKGITGSSIGSLLTAAGYTVFMQKFDGYLNVDAGTINPYKHGEVFVTEDGAETDLDIGHYERFLDRDMNHMSIFTSGKLMQELMHKERKGDYLGSDVQIIPHFTNLIKEKIQLANTANQADISIIEVGGTVGDMENEAIVEAVRQLRQDFGYHNTVYIHLAYIPYLLASKELKTKPAQNSVKDLRMRGIIPDFLICRADYPLPESIMEKVAYMTGVKREHVIPAPTVDSIYTIPLDYHHRHVGEYILDHLQLPYTEFAMDKREELAKHRQASQEEITIALVWKYGTIQDADYSLIESLKVAGFYHHRKVRIVFVNPEELNEKNVADRLSGMAWICVPGGFGNRGIEWMICAIRYAREHKVPYLGICLGSQLMAIEFARHVLGYSDATSEEFDLDHTSKHHIVHIMEHQKSIDQKGGTMRLGSYPCVLTEWSKVAVCYKKFHNTLLSVGERGWGEVSERHRHRYEFNNDYRQEFDDHRFIISGTSPDGSLVEMVELSDHPFMVATQAHPELKARPTKPHPLMMGFIQAICQE